jgi:hypothetical protein
MERGVYFDAWFPRQHCYHPSKPSRRLKMVQDLCDYQATVLVWSALGGGSISLPYLEDEAFGKIPPRFRLYGFMNDSEFIRECHKHGIKVFGIVFEIQGWEFPVELNEAEDIIWSMNELRGVGKPGWIGLREFNQNRYPRIWAPFEKYFPRGLVNSLGERVTDLPEECCSRDIYGNALHARWVECPDREHQCYLMDRNNPVWREYLKAIIRIQVDAGVDGIQLDEAELPITSIQYGGCFCKDCMRLFREYLQSLPPEKLPRPLEGADLSAFHYGEWLLAQGFDFQADREDSPLFWDYLRFQRATVARYFGELADYARKYAASQGREVLVSGNFFNAFDHYYAFEPHVDMIISEMRNTQYRQPAWFRYLSGFAGHKPVVVCENPYGGIVAGLIDMLKAGKGFDRFRASVFEGAAMGVNMTLPYGAWMGSVIEDSFYVPHELGKEVYQFLAEHNRLYSRHTCNDTAVIYSVASNWQSISRRDLFADNRSNATSSESIPFWDVCESLSDHLQPYDVVMFPDGELRGDLPSVEALLAYRTIILPDCRTLPLPQLDLLQAYLDRGGRLLVLGELAANLPGPPREALLAHPGAVLSTLPAFDPLALPGGPQLRAQPRANLALNIQRVPGGAALHLVSYDYDEAQDRVPALPELSLDLRLPGAFTAAEVFSPGVPPELSFTVKAGETHPYHLRLKNLPLYTVILLK